DAGEQWNAPTARTLAPGETMTVGVRLTPSPTIRGIEATLAAAGRPVAVGIPGYVVPMDSAATVFVKARSPIARIDSWPAGALDTAHAGTVHGWTRLSVR
ncbi:DUF5695 domain-containing protein, partial [Escherichia coli]|nr:DUF5695 domain-containing protein [Escherichia coli]